MTPPLRFGPYELLEVVGGGMGIVHRARRVGDDRELAIKLMRQERLLDGEARARFLRELAAMRRLDHPAICPLLDAGEIDGMPFLCMPWIPGSCLDAVLRAARDRGDAALSLPGQAPGPAWRAIVGLFAKVADALQVAHEHGVVHRDVKPANLRIDPHGEPMLLDFGLARDSADRYRDLTRTGQVVGTPAYLAPEQLEARRGAIGPRTDVYGLGAVLYEALTLQQPFVGNSRFELFQRILRGNPPDPRQLAADLPAALVEVLEVAMARRPQERHASMAVLAADLRAVLAGRPIVRRRPPVVVRWSRWFWQRRRQGLAACLFLVAAVPLAGRAFESTGVHAQTAVPSWQWPARLLTAWRDYAALPPPWPSHRAALAGWLAEYRELAAAPPAAESAAPGLQQFAIAAVADVEARLAHVDLVQRALIDARPTWLQAAEAVAAAPHYRGLVLVPQPGLLPLQADPKSSRQEFYDLASGDPELSPPTRDEHGVLQLRERHGIVLVLVPGEGAIPPFLLGKHEVTRAQYARLAHGIDPSVYRIGEAVLGNIQTWRHPVDRVQYHEAVALLGRWGMQLPTPPRWEYAAASGSHGDSWPSYLDAESERGTIVCWPVGTFAANTFGLHDMFGNVAELCADPQPPAPASPDGRPQHHVRGGQFAAPRMTASQVDYTIEGDRRHKVGLRAARSLEMP